MNLSGVLLARGRPADDGAKRDQSWLFSVCLRLLNCLVQSCNVLVVVAVATPVNLKGLPTVSTVASCHILSEGDVGVVLDGNLIGIVNGN